MRANLRVTGPAALVLCMMAQNLWAQSDAGPLSAIDWLSETVRSAPVAPKAADIANSATPPAIVTTPLGQIKPDAVGLLSSATTGLAAEFWGTSSTATLQALVSAQRADLPPPLAAFLRMLLLAELKPPTDSDGRGVLFLARVDKLLDIGALDEARALIERAGPTTPEMFRRWFDISLLTGLEDQACRVMLAKPQIAPTYPARIFCLARGGDWDAAAVTLNSARSLGLIDAAEDALLARFLDPELFEGAPDLPPPDRLTPLGYRMHEAIGEPLALSRLPNAFAFASLSPLEGWKTRLTAAERLARTGAIRPETLKAVYEERAPAASGGVWDRVAAVQALDVALLAGTPDKVSQTVPSALRTMRSAGLEAAFAGIYGERLARIPLSGPAARDTARVAFLSDAYEAVAKSETLPENVPALWRAVARGDVPPPPPEDGSEDPVEAAIIAAFSDAEPPADLSGILKARKLGEAALEALILMQDGALADPAGIEHGLATLRQMGLEDVVRRTALWILITRPRR